MAPTTGQLLLLTLSIAFFAVGGGLSIARLWGESAGYRRASMMCLAAGVAVAIAVIVWHSVSRGGWVPINDNFDALVWLGALLALLVLYLQNTRPVSGLEWFTMPIVILMLGAAGFFGSRESNQYQPLVSNTWAWTHRITAYGGALAFAIAGALGAMYVLASRRLRNRHRPKNKPAAGNHSLTSPPPFESLERLERMTMVSVTLGFALLTVGLVTGVVEMMKHDQATSTPKVILASLAWLVYAVVMHAPINPRFRGRRAAMLSVLGFVLVFGTLIAVQFVPAGR